LVYCLHISIEPEVSPHHNQCIGSFMQRNTPGIGIFRSYGISLLILSSINLLIVRPFMRHYTSFLFS
jgi:hypothetical protein